MIIDVLTTDGSPLGVTVKTLWGDDPSQIGVGGAELALLTMCEEWTKAGHEVVLYNDPRIPDGSSFEQRPCDTFEPMSKRDVIIIFRSPNARGVVSKGLRVWWSTDQYTVGGFERLAPFMNRIVCISDFHADYFKSKYQIENAIVIDLPIRVEDFVKTKVDKVPNRLIFTSIADRGLKHLRDMWPDIKSGCPNASLVITSDYRLWGSSAPRNELYRMAWIGQDDIQFLGAISRTRLVEEYLKAQIFAFPNIYFELFCISCGEAQFAGAYPVTSTVGALVTTNMGSLIEGTPGSPDFSADFVGEITRLLDNSDELEQKQGDVKQKALERFHPEEIVEQWDEKVFKKG